jgi:hypothetical protein
MGRLLYLVYPWGMILQAIALVHFVRRRPDNYWLWIILMFGGIGAGIYLATEAVPDVALLRGTIQRYPRRRRIRELEVVVSQNPAPGNYEELADLYFDDKQYARARECFDHAITKRNDSIDPFYRRGLCKFELQDYAAAIPDLEYVASREFSYGYHRAAGLLATCYGFTNQPERADLLFQRVLQASTATEMQYRCAEFLSSHSRNDDARDILDHIKAKTHTMTRFQKRFDRPWLRRAAALRKRLPSRSAKATA